MTELPQNWIECELIKVADLYTGNSINEKVKSEKYTNLSEGINYIATKDIGYDKKINYNNGVKIPVAERGFKVAPAKSTLLCIEGGSAGRKIGYTREDVCFVNKLCAFVSKLSEENSRWIYYYLQSYDFKSQFFDKKNGLIGGVGVNKLKQLKIKLPPENEQKRIVKKLDAIIPKVDEVNSRLERVPLILKRARQSILNQAITGELTKDWRKEHNITESWETTTFKSIATKLTDGSHNPPPKKVEGYPVISAKNIKNNQIVIDTVERYTDEEGFLKENKRTNIKYGDIILGIIGASIGNIAIYKLNQKVIAQRSIAIIDTNINNEYVYYYMSSPIYQNCLIDKTKGAAQGGVYLSELGSIEIQVPTMEEQEEIVKQVKKAFEKLDKIEEQYKKAKSYTDRITQSILHKAFTGNLVPQDPNDKPVEINEKQMEIKNKNKTITYEKLIHEVIKMKKNLIEIIEDYPNGIFPEDLFNKSKYSKTNYTDEDIIAFYKELSELMDSKLIEEKDSKHYYTVIKKG